MNLQTTHTYATNRTRLTYPDGQYMVYVYDALNRVTQVRENGLTSGAGGN